MRADGYYWVRTILFGSSSVLLYRNGEWQDDLRMGEEGLEALAGPLAPPTAADLAGQAAHFAAELEAEWKLHGCDPRWDGHWLQGFYWVRLDGRPGPEIALFLEGNWVSLEWDGGDGDWHVHEGEPGPKVLTGPLRLPKGSRRKGQPGRVP